MVLAWFPMTSSWNPACYILGLIHGTGRRVPNENDMLHVCLHHSTSLLKYWFPNVNFKPEQILLTVTFWPEVLGSEGERKGDGEGRKGGGRWEKGGGWRDKMGGRGEKKGEEKGGMEKEKGEEKGESRREKEEGEGDLLYYPHPLHLYGIWPQPRSPPHAI